MIDILSKWRKEILLSLVILALAFFLRSFNLNSIPIFADEAIYVRWAQVMRASPENRFIPLSDGKQPLFMWSIIPFLKIIEDPLVAGRMVSVVAGLGSLVGIFILTYLLFKSYNTSFAASLFYAVSPLSVFFDRMALVDSMLTFFGVWTLVFAVLVAKKIRLDTAMLAGFSLGGALLTKSPAIFFAALVPLALILHKWPRKFKKRFNRASVFVFLFTFTYIIAWGLYNILRLGPEFHMIAIRNQDYVYPFSHILTSPFDPLLPFLHRIFEYFWLMGPSFLILFFALGVWKGLRNYGKETLILLAWGILPILAVAALSKTMTTRYIYFSIPYIFILSALFSDTVLPKKESGANPNHPKGDLGWHLTDFGKTLGKIFDKRGLGILALLIFVGHSLFTNYRLLTEPEAASLPRSEKSGYLEEWTAGYGIREISVEIRNRYLQNPGHKIVVGTEGYFGTLPDGLQVYLHNLPEITVIGVGLDLKEIPQSLIESKLAGNKTYLVINDSRLLADPEDIGLQLIKVYSKPSRPDGTHESLLFFEVK